jgi:hypothetical protein
MSTARLCLALIATAAVAFGDDMTDAAAEAVKAFAARDAGALRALASRDDPDPWVVADEVFASGGYEAALAFASAAPRKDVEGLPALVRSWRERAPDPSFREAIRSYNDAARADDVAETANTYGV